MIGAAIAFRLLALFSIPNLSDDYFRFIWDGRLLAHDTNPFMQLPADYMEAPEEASRLGLSQELYEGLNSPNYFTIYPPVNQAVFWLAASIAPNSINGSILLMKLMLFLAELGTIYLLIQLLNHWKLPRETLVFYALNPLVIVELVGNLHFEALMIFFLLLSIWLLTKGKWKISTIPYALAICSKLLPIMLLPFMLRRLGFKQTIIYGLLVAVVCMLCFLPIFKWETFTHLFDSVSLYFQKFEFNASIYYIVRWLGFQIKGYNIIQTAGKYLALTTVLGILLLVFFEYQPKWKTLPAAMLWAFMLYFSMASIVHPWYATTLVALATLSNWRFPLIWTFLLPITYFTYRSTAYEENLWLVAIEYIILAAWMLWEVSNMDFNKFKTKLTPYSFKKTEPILRE